MSLFDTLLNTVTTGAVTYGTKAILGGLFGVTGNVQQKDRLSQQERILAAEANLATIRGERDRRLDKAIKGTGFISKRMKDKSEERSSRLKKKISANREYSLTPQTQEVAHAALYRQMNRQGAHGPALALLQRPYLYDQEDQKILEA